MLPLIGVREISIIGHELVETKGPRADGGPSFLAGERRFPRQSQQGP